MPRYALWGSLVLLGFGCAETYGCAPPAPDDDDDSPTETTSTVGIVGGTGNQTSGTPTTTTTTTTTTTSGSGGTGNTNAAPPFETACPELAAAISEGQRGERCGAEVENAKPKQVNMLIVLDRSGSMNQNDKWGAMKAALRSALGAVESDINFGLELYPTPALPGGVIDLEACGAAGNCCEMPAHFEMNVPIGSGADAVNTIVQTLDATEPGGGTPTTVALERALAYFTEGEGRDLEGDKYVLLATDGGPNCNASLSCGGDLCTFNLDDPERDCRDISVDNNCCAGSGLGCVDATNVVNRIEALAQNGINTFVVGIPGSEAYSSFLNEFADAGGRPSGDATYRYFRVDDVAELTSVFEAITVELVTNCNLVLEKLQVEAPAVVIDCKEIPKLVGAAGAAGEPTYNWLWEPNTSEITLVGDTCARVEQGVGRIDILLNCPPIE